MIYIWIVIFAVAMGYFEASVVVYLRSLYYPHGFSFPLAAIPDRILLVEAGREIASLFMITAVAWVAGRKLPQRIALFFVIFALWDIVYYAVLLLSLHWPWSFATWDVLFLLPIPWTAPVLAPLLASVTLFIFGTVIYHLDYHGAVIVITSRDLIVSLAASCPILISFFLNAEHITGGRFPEHYSWPLFVLGLLMAWIYFLLCVKRWNRMEWR